LEDQDLEANTLLGTIYQRLDDIVSSAQALERASKNPQITQERRAELDALVGRNWKARWRTEWESKPLDQRAAAALRSPHLQESFEKYESAFNKCLNHYYSGLNALAMLKIMIAAGPALSEGLDQSVSERQEGQRGTRGPRRPCEQTSGCNPTLA
jgi:hypothetical protein